MLLRRACAILIHALAAFTIGCLPCCRCGAEQDADGDRRSGQLVNWSRRCAACWCGGDEFIRLEHSFSRRLNEGFMVLPWPFCWVGLHFQRDAVSFTEVPGDRSTTSESTAAQTRAAEQDNSEHPWQPAFDPWAV